MGGLINRGGIAKLFGKSKRVAADMSGAGVTGATGPGFEGSTQHTGIDLTDRQQQPAPPGTVEGTPAGRRRRGRRGLGGPKGTLAAQTVMSNT